ncbi:hypothetical protein [Phyllobacterium leguminum]|uniref:Uncharacterized protein n=1 Tax=Phyllobacterium leguminum TaxID=314237 RepID=A0A318T450_9HYPH|nr:hypothetical protein [Phyllobacterium leguminum]PYE89582.1 hypothetical protein C7477_10390 [Phyllobacterium leguminum]
MSENLIQSLTNVTKKLSETVEEGHRQFSADTALLLALYATLLNKGIITPSDLDGISRLGQGDDELSNRIHARLEIIKKNANV